MTENEALRIVANPHLKWKCHEVDSALTIIRNALEKQVAKKPETDEFDYGEGYVFPVCESFLHYVDDDDEHVRTNYCCHCGARINWSEE